MRYFIQNKSHEIFFPRELIRATIKEGFITQAQLVRELYSVATKPIFKYLLGLFDLYVQELDIIEDLECEKRKYESKLVKGEHKLLLEESRHSRQNFSKDTQLLIRR